jgi:homospermidine synthase
MLASNRRIFFVGFGAVAGCTLPILLDLIKVDPRGIMTEHSSNAFHGYNRPRIDPADPWQFKNFLLTDGD